MDDGDDVVKHLIITGVKFTDRVVGEGVSGRVFAVDYNGVMCAAKEIRPRLLGDDVAAVDRSWRKRMYLREFLLLSKLHHPNIVKMLGVYYRNDQAVLPVLVMELMECNLTQLLENYQNIPMYVKLSILQDVSRAICYLHTLNPPMMHRDLYSENIVLTTSLVAKVCDFMLIKEVPPYSSNRMTGAPGNHDFMSPEALRGGYYGLPLDVFSFGCVVCHMITQQWPRVSSERIRDPKTRRLVALTEVERRQHYIDQISEGSLKQLVITCLDDYPNRRPPISVVSERITNIITG